MTVNTENEYKPFYDELTGLPNGLMFEYEFRSRIESGNQKGKLSIAYIDIDNFKFINSTLGHRVGNEFLKHIANNLKKVTSGAYFVARLGGDEFVIVFEGNFTDKELLKKIDLIRKRVCHTWSYLNQKYYVSISVGISKYPEDGIDLDTIFQKAEIAMYAAKQSEKDIVLYKNGLREGIFNQMEMVNKLRTGIENNEFTLYFQPQYELNTQKIIGMEVLLRWIHPVDGFISPAIFIPVAEKSKQIYILDHWVLNRALKQKKIWEEEGFGHIEISINISSKTLESDVDFPKIERILSYYDVDYSKVVIEITETALFNDMSLVIERINRLKKIGLKIALDDFGTGYSSLSHFKDLPIDIIKLDKSFIELIAKGNNDALIIKNMVSMAHDKHYTVVAEGIETTQELEYLKRYDCETGQGYLLSMPLPVEKVNHLIKDSGSKSK